MKNFRLFATALMVVLCATIVSSCSDDDDGNKDKEQMSLIVGKWFYDADYYGEEYVFKSDGTWEIFSDYSGSYEKEDGGKYWIESGVLYMESIVENETWIIHIKKLDSKELIFDEGKKSDKRFVKVK